MSAASTDKSRNLPIIARKGDSFDLDLNVVDARVDPSVDFDFTDCTVELHVYASTIEAGTPVLSFTVGQGLTLSTGLIALSKSAFIMNTFRRDDNRTYFLRITDSNDKKSLWLNGPFIINEGEYDDNSTNETLTIADSVEVNLTIS